MECQVAVSLEHLEHAIAAAERDPEQSRIETYDLLAQAIEDITGASNSNGIGFDLGDVEMRPTPKDWDMAMQLVDDFDGGHYEELRDVLPLTLVFHDGDENG
jgi:hypothetical protein